MFHSTNFSPGGPKICINTWRLLQKNSLHSQNLEKTAMESSRDSWWSDFYTKIPGTIPWKLYQTIESGPSTYEDVQDYYSFLFELQRNEKLPLRTIKVFTNHEDGPQMVTTSSIGSLDHHFAIDTLKFQLKKHLNSDYPKTIATGTSIVVDFGNKNYVIYSFPQ